MLRSLALGLAGLIVSVMVRSAGPPPPLPTGPELAASLRELRPVEGSGVMRLRNPDGRWTAQVPVKVTLLEQKDSRQVFYEAFGPDGIVNETLTVIHAAGRPTVYVLATGGHEPRRLTGAPAAVTFAGSEFWLSDLGLEFLDWPDQKIVKRETRKGRDCLVLASSNPNPDAGGHARVLSWVDVEHRAIVRAEAFDVAGHLQKEFSIGSFSRVKGPDGESHWQLKSMDIRNEQTDARTRLEFDLKLPADPVTPPPAEP